MNAHRMQRMPCNRDGGADIVFGDGLHRRAARIRRFGIGGLFAAHAIAPRAPDGEHGACASHCGLDSTRQPHYSFLVASLFPAIAPLAGCRGPMSALDPAGPAADSIATLWWVMFAGATSLFALVMALLWWAYRKPGFAVNSSPRTWLLHAGVLMPAVILTALAGYALFLGERLIAPTHTEIVRVEAIATRWVWRFSYPQHESVSDTAVLHIPAGRMVEVRVRSEDVIHSFWVPRLAGKIDAIPGHETRVQLKADRPGEYEGTCAEFCGLGHTDMRFRVIAHDAERFPAAIMEGAR